MGPDGKDQPGNSISACGYSTLMILLTLLFLVLMAGVAAALSSRPLNAPMPLVGTSSPAVNAACHHPHDVKTEARKPLLRSVTKKPTADGKPGQFSFSSRIVSYPVPGQLCSQIAWMNGSQEVVVSPSQEYISYFRSIGHYSALF